MYCTSYHAPYGDTDQLYVFSDSLSLCQNHDAWQERLRLYNCNLCSTFASRAGV